MGLVLLGILLIGSGLIAFRMGSVGSFLPPVEGTVVESKVVRTSRRDTSASFETPEDHANRGEWQDFFQPSIVYEYVVDGVPRRSAGLSITAGDAKVLYASKEAAEARVRRYPVGASVQVFRKRSDPDVSVLEPGAPRMAKTAVILGAVVLCVAFGSRMVAGAA